MLQEGSVRVLVKGLRVDQKPSQEAAGTLSGIGCGSSSECLTISPSAHKLPPVETAR